MAIDPKKRRAIFEIIGVIIILLFAAYFLWPYLYRIIEGRVFEIANMDRAASGFKPPSGGEQC
jgi:F0F1-type ATP synthase membrane subunit b/b'